MAGDDEYLLGYARAEQKRLLEQARQLAVEAEWLFDQVGVGTGARVVEIGCGPEGCLGLLATRVGPSGTVVGVERNRDDVELARAMVRARDLRNVEVRHGDGRATGLPRSAFDVVTARLVLVNVPQPEEIVGEAFALVRSGGAVAFHEFDWVASLCDPPCDEWSRAMELLESYSRANGIDQAWGRRP